MTISKDVREIKYNQKGGKGEMKKRKEKKKENQDVHLSLP